MVNKGFRILIGENMGDLVGSESAGPIFLYHTGRGKISGDSF
jgi:hypothetical protein